MTKTTLTSNSVVLDLELELMKLNSWREISISVG